MRKTMKCRKQETEVFNDMLTGYANEANRNIPGGYTQSATGMPSGSAPDESGGLPHKDEPRIVKVGNRHAERKRAGRVWRTTT